MSLNVTCKKASERKLLFWLAPHVGKCGMSEVQRNNSVFLPSILEWARHMVGFSCQGKY